jgi:hypothetical protein
MPPGSDPEVADFESDRIGIEMKCGDGGATDLRQPDEPPPLLILDPFLSAVELDDEALASSILLPNSLANQDVTEAV